MDPSRTPSPRRPGEDHVKDHPAANELVEEEELRPDPEPDVPPERRATPPVPRQDRKIGRFALGVGLLIVALGVVLAFIFLRDQPELIWIGGALFVLMMLFFFAPIWLGESTKIVQDEQVKEQRKHPPS